MRKLFILGLSLFFAFAISSCSKDDDEEQSSVVLNPTENKDSILIVYYSRAGENYGVGTVSIGNTAVMAGYIQDYTGAETFEIVPTVPYPDDYDEMCEVSRQETAANARPAFNGQIENWDHYSVVFVGSPVWYGAPPMIMRTFYEKYQTQLEGKTIVPFGTHAGSGVNSCTNLLREYFPTTVLLETLGISGTNVRTENARQEVETWLESIGFQRNEDEI